MIPEAAIAMLACARIGAVHSVVFGGFSAESLRDRINDAQAVCLITADGGYRRGRVLPLKRFADEALAECPSIKHVVVVQRRPGAAGDEAFANMTEGRDHWWHRLLDAAASPTARPRRWTPRTCCSSSIPRAPPENPRASSTPPAAISPRSPPPRSTSSTCKEDDVFWCTADIGWVTGHSYVVYGPLANGATVLMYEGAPDWPERDRFWKICARYGVTVFYTAPTAIRAFMKWGEQSPRRSTTSPPSACSARWASRSIPRPGSGTTSTSAANAAPSWTPGGRPRPAAS